MSDPQSASPRWRDVWKHPILHFMLIGAALFGLNAWTHAGEQPQDERAIEVTRPQLEALAGIWRAQFGRPPSETELTTVAKAWAVEEMRVREAKRLGLDRDDSVIRRRLAQKYEFLVNNPASLTPPSDAVLRKYLADHIDRYGAPSRYSVEQIFFSSDRGRSQALVAAQAALANPGAAHGDAFPGEPVEHQATEAEIRQDFGSNFAAALPRLKPDVWDGPVESGFGFHLVRVTERAAVAPPDFNSVKGQVLADWLADAAQDAAKKAEAALEARYQVALDPNTVRRVVGAQH